MDKNLRSEEIFGAKNWGFRAKAGGANKAGTGLVIASRNWQRLLVLLFPVV